MGKDFEHLQKPSFERVPDGHVGADEVVGCAEPAVAFVVRVVLVVEIVAAVKEMGGVGEHLRQIPVADEHR